LARLSGDILPIRLIAVGAGPCEQSEQNDECIAGGCPLFQR
jgi:hypothetical protein